MELSAIPVTLVVAVARNGVIGREGQLPWRLPSDLKRFKALTLGKPVVMGRKTFQSIGRPLPGRPNLVITRDAAFDAPGIHVFSGLDPAIAAARAMAASAGSGAGPREVCVIGGGEIYAQALPQATRIYLTRVDLAPQGDAVFPDLDPAVWQEVAREDVLAGPVDDGDFSLLTLERARSSAVPDS